jgi:predicted DNA-binding WGR domain protein
VYAKDWHADEKYELEKVLNVLNGRNDSSPSLTPPIPVNNNKSDLEFHFLQSADNLKFWQIARDKNQLHIRFGKTGTQGQVQVKSFELEADAELAMEEMIRGQMEGGFGLGE